MTHEEAKVCLQALSASKHLVDAMVEIGLLEDLEMFGDFEHDVRYSIQSFLSVRRDVEVICSDLKEVIVEAQRRQE